MNVSDLFLFASSPGPQVTSLDTPHAQYVIIRRSGGQNLAKVVPFGG